MITKPYEPSTLRLFQYVVASADMYYAEQEQRDVFLGRDDAGHIRIWGQTANGGPSTRIGLCRVFLEYGLYCSSWCSRAEANYHMQNFGDQLGHRLAKYLQANPALLAPDDPTVRALEQVFGAIGADFSEDHIEAGVRFLLTYCPVEDAAKRSGLPYVELAHHGINAMCRSLILDMNPRLIVYTSPDTLPEFMFTISTAIPA
jgi:hypothetical protein